MRNTISQKRGVFTRWAIVIVAAHALATSAKAAPAPETSCEPPNTQVEQESSRTIDPNMPINLQIGDLRFQIPYAYVYPRPFSSHLGCNPNRRAFGFAFWMPDLRPPERDPLYESSYRPNENGQADEDASHFRVIASTVEHASPSDPNARPRPAFLLRNIINLFKSDFRMEAVNGIIHLIPLSNQFVHDIYFNLSSPNQSFLLSCSTAGNIPNPGCVMDVYYDDLAVAIHASMPRDRLFEADAVASAMYSLLIKWRATK